VSWAVSDALLGVFPWHRLPKSARNSTQSVPVRAPDRPGGLALCRCLGSLCPFPMLAKINRAADMDRRQPTVRRSQSHQMAGLCLWPGDRPAGDAEIRHPRSAGVLRQRSALAAALRVCGAGCADPARRAWRVKPGERGCPRCRSRSRRDGQQHTRSQSHALRLGLGAFMSDQVRARSNAAQARSNASKSKSGRRAAERTIASVSMSFPIASPSASR
jgi:hypothetical protein